MHFTCGSDQGKSTTRHTALFVCAQKGDPAEKPRHAIFWRFRYRLRPIRAPAGAITTGSSPTTA